MHSIEETGYGYRLKFDGFMNKQDMEGWFADLKKHVSSTSGSYGALIDLRGAVAFPAEAQEVLFEGIHYSLANGMDRNAVVVSNAIAKIQATRIAKETGISDKVRFFDASADPDWEKKALEWAKGSGA